MHYQQYLEFEELIKEIFIHNDFKILEENKKYSYNVSIQELDFSTLFNNKTYAVEVKFYRQAKQNVSLLKKAIKQLFNAMRATQIKYGLLVTSSYITDERKQELEKMGIIIIERLDLFDMASSSIPLTERLISFLEDSVSYTGSRNTLERIKLSPEHTYEVKSFPDYFLESIDKDTSTVNLCKELKEISSGKTEWTQYEKKCVEILKYLFNDDLIGWKEQESTYDDLNRFDLITRIRSISDFWKFISSELNSRYILFEFKNYSEQIKQGQILTTEKYLYKQALRSVVFILSRKGANDNAIKFSQGAMREHAKLIITLSDEDLCNMINLKNAGDDPNDYMFELVDNFLMTLPR